MDRAEERLVLGIGCRKGARPEDLRLLVEDVLVRAGIDRRELAAIATLDTKGAEPAVVALSDTLGLPVRLFSAVMLERETPRLATPSHAVFLATGCHGIAEAAALVTAGPQAVLVVPKQTGAGVTAALAGTLPVRRSGTARPGG